MISGAMNVSDPEVSELHDRPSAVTSAAAVRTIDCGVS